MILAPYNFEETEPDPTPPMWTLNHDGTVSIPPGCTCEVLSSVTPIPGKPGWGNFHVSRTPDPECEVHL